MRRDDLDQQPGTNPPVTLLTCASDVPMLCSYVR
jgi:hypothetical protein